MNQVIFCNDGYKNNVNNAVVFALIITMNIYFDDNAKTNVLCTMNVNQHNCMASATIAEARTIESR